MNNVTRRNLLAGTAGAAAAVVLPFETPVKAATPLAGKQAPGWYRYKVGSVEVTVVTDGVARFKMAEDHVTNNTGTGESNYKKSGGVGGQFVTNLTAAGIDRGAVDTVIISHYHGDHINGLLMDDNSLTYPNAEILVPAIEHAFWMDDGEER